MIIGKTLNEKFFSGKIKSNSGNEGFLSIKVENSQ